MGRKAVCGSKKQEKEEGMKKKGAWTAEEDHILSLYIHSHGESKWNSLPRRAGLKRCGKSCRLRWLNYLRPDIKRGNISPDEEDLIIRLHKLLGNRWSLIAGRLPGRTDNEIKNYWNTTLYKKLMAASGKQPEKANPDSQKPAPAKTTGCFNHLSLPLPQDDLQFMDETSPHVNFGDETLNNINSSSFHEFRGGCFFGENEAVQGGRGVIHKQQMMGGVDDDFSFISELLDCEGGWVGNF